jgi:putative heme-binding domain-containing protein
LAALAEVSQAEPEVRLQLACTARRLPALDSIALLHSLMRHKEDAGDPCLPLMLWLAYEPRVESHRDEVLNWLREHAPGNPLVTEAIVPRALRRLAVTTTPENLAACTSFIGSLRDSAVRRKALEGMAEALKGRQLDPPVGWRPLLAALRADADPAIRELARHLAVTFRDPIAIRRALETASDADRDLNRRMQAIRDLALAHPSEAQEVLLKLATAEGNLELRVEACRALAGYDDERIAKALLAGWKDYPAPLRNEAVSLLAGRRTSALALLDAVADKRISRADLTDNTILRMRAQKNKDLDTRIKTVWGQFRDTPAELHALIDRMRKELAAGPASFERGRKVFEQQCAKCHQFEGKGFDVGPNLDGAARDLEYLLANILDPNRAVGQPYFMRVANLKNGRVETGLLVAEDETTITLKTENGVQKVIVRKDIEELAMHPKSIMPEGLANNMTVQDFRDLVRYAMAHPYLAEVRVHGPWTVKNDPGGPELPASSNPPPTVAVPVTGRIALPPAKGDAAVVYLQASVTAAGAVKSRLLLGGDAALRVWLNGVEVYKGRPGPNPDEDGVNVELRDGRNDLVLRVEYKGEAAAVYARFLDPLRKLRNP